MNRNKNQESSERPKSFSPSEGGATSTHRIDMPSSESLTYTSTADWMVLREDEEPVAEIFYVYYHRYEEPRPDRPVTFVFNGGPGAASAYLHMGAVGPNRVSFGPNGELPESPIELEENMDTWLAFSDLVFIDPMGTGFSRPVYSEKDQGNSHNGKNEKNHGGEATNDSEETEQEFYKMDRDLDALGEFIQKFLSQFQRWDSPKYIAGESYGGFRVAKMTRKLQEDEGVGLNGAILISPALEIDALLGSDYDLLHWIDVFPTMVAAAFIHGRSTAFDGDSTLQEVLSTGEQFATNQLSRLLAAGEGMNPEERQSILEDMQSLLGLPMDFLEKTGGRIPLDQFSRTLLEDERVFCGLYDASITTVDPFPDRNQYEGPDPTLVGTSRIFTSAINVQLRKYLDVETSRDYHLLRDKVMQLWEMDDDDKHAFEGVEGATDDLRYGMALNPDMDVMISHGYFDLITPYFASNRLSQLMKLTEEQQNQITLNHYEGGHMFYTWSDSRTTFRDDIQALMTE